MTVGNHLFILVCQLIVSRTKWLHKHFRKGKGRCNAGHMSGIYELHDRLHPPPIEWVLFNKMNKRCSVKGKLADSFECIR